MINNMIELESETHFKKRVEKYLDSLNAYRIKIAPSLFMKAGLPDLIFCVNGHFCAVELKTNVGKVAPLQQRNIDMINKSGGFARIIKPDNFEEWKLELNKNIGIVDD